ncbi:hypothetical protein R3P38DRAFT_818327 [Favolaschia claudopus]|uniref:GDP-fucose protein O-fucosyltransferase 2 n=1 Tax=Favolaschia claudopus TaxID=2862362 RepID=A0AAW0BYX6_9AGAR
MFAHSPDDYTETSSVRRREIPLRGKGRRILFGFGFWALGCSIGFGLASSWGPSWGGSGSQMQDCVAHFDSPRPVLEGEAPHVVTEPPGGGRPITQTLLKGPPTAAFRDNLQPDVQYITTWPGSGWTNDVLLYMNLLYFAMITERVPVIPYFTPTHVGKGNAPTLPFGEVFDIPRIENATGLRILEWHQVKDSESEVVDTLGCWSIWKAVQSFNTEPHFTSAPGRLKLDVSYTTAPRWIKMDSNDQNAFATFWTIASLAFPETRARNLQAPTLSPIRSVALPPDEHMVCYDYLYYVGTYTDYEWESDFSPAWRFVGRHMHWTPQLQQLAERYTREALGLASYQATPPYIAVHVRRGDFANWCNNVPINDCFPSFDVIERRVEEVKGEIYSKKRIRVDRVIVTSDEEDPAWWAEVAKLGWSNPDHSRTADVHGKWYPLLIDAVIQSSAIGFVGTDRSTVSVIARKRIQTWNSGISRTVKWGSPGADDH